MAGAASRATPAPGWGATAAAVSVWYTSSVGVLLLNKVLLSSHGFRFPISLTALHMLSCSGLSWLNINVLRLAQPVKLRDRKQAGKVGVLALVFCASVTAGNVSLRYIPASFSQAVGATTPFFTAIISYAIQRRVETLATYLMLVPVVAGVAVGVQAEPALNFVGLVAALAATATRALKSVLQAVLLAGDDGIDSQNLLRFMSPIAAGVLVPAAALAEGAELVSFLLTRGDAGPWLGGLLLLSGCTAYLVNLSNFLVTKCLGALTLQVLGNAKGAVGAAVSVAVFRNPITRSGALGYAATVLGVAAYSSEKRFAHPSKAQLRTVRPGSPQDGQAQQRRRSAFVRPSRPIALASTLILCIAALPRQDSGGADEVVYWADASLDQCPSRAQKGKAKSRREAEHAAALAKEARARRMAGTEPLGAWAEAHVTEALESVHGCLKCDHVHEQYRYFIAQANEWQKKAALVHVTDKGEVYVRGDLVDDFTLNYVTGLCETLSGALQTNSCGGRDGASGADVEGAERPQRSTSFIVTSLAFAEQLRTWDETTHVPLFSSCMTSRTARMYGVSIPRPYHPLEDLHWSRGLGDPDAELTRLWDSKRGQVAFRGALSAEDRAHLKRRQQSMGPSDRSLVDVELTGVPDGAPCMGRREIWCAGAPRRWVEELGLRVAGKNASMTMSAQVERYRYILSADGVGCADRLKMLLASSSAVMVQASPYREFWYSDLQPNVHFIPVDAAFGNLTAAVRRSEASHSSALRVVRSANAYVHRYMTPAATSCYFRTLLRDYGEHTSANGACDVPSGALPWEEWLRQAKKATRKYNDNKAAGMAHPAARSAAVEAWWSRKA